MVAQVEQLVELETLLSDRVFLDVNLKLLPRLLQMGEPGLAHEADGHDAPGDSHRDARSFQLLAGLVRIGFENLRNGMRELVLAGVGRLAQCFNLLELVAAKFVNLLVECHRE